MTYQIIKIEQFDEVWYQIIVERHVYWFLFIPVYKDWFVEKYSSGKVCTFKTVEEAESYMQKTYGKPTYTFVKENYLDVQS